MTSWIKVAMSGDSAPAFLRLFIALAVPMDVRKEIHGCDARAARSVSADRMNPPDGNLLSSGRYFRLNWPCLEEQTP